MEQALELSPILKKLHFIKLETCNPEQDSVDYRLRNHFDAAVMEIHGKFSSDGSCIEFLATDSQAEKQSCSSEIFRFIIKKACNCELMSMAGQTLGSVVMKDTRLSTYKYEVLDRTGMVVFQVVRKQIGDGQTEFNITGLSSNNLVARINIHDSKVFLSMAPELDSLSKSTFVCLMLLTDLVENQPEKYGREASSTAGIGGTSKSHITQTLVA